MGMGNFPILNILNFFGELAQLGEHLLCTQRVSGSIPLFSTIFHYLKVCFKLIFMGFKQIFICVI